MRKPRIKGDGPAEAMARSKTEPLEPCPHGDGNACWKYRLQGMRCQDCPLIWGETREGPVRAEKWRKK